MPPGSITDSDTLWFEHLSRTRNPQFRLFCFSHAGGNGHGFRNWRRCFPPELDLCLVHLPGRGKRIGEEAFTRLGPLVTAVANEISGQASPPFAFYGHSLGALISFELTRELRRRGRCGPQCLFLSGHRAPHLHNTQAAIFDLPELEFVQKLKELNGTPTELLDEPQTREFFLPMFRADFEIVDTYEYHDCAPLPCPMNVYGGLADESVSVDSIRAWPAHTSAECRVRMFSGDHFFVYDPATNFLQAFRGDLLAAMDLSCAQKV